MIRRRVLLHTEAAAEFRDAVRWYDDRAPRLGQLVLSELRWVVDRLRSFPDAYPQVRPGVRRATVGRLPHLLIYSATDDTVTLLALARVGRDPWGIERRLAERDPP